MIEFKIKGGKELAALMQQLPVQMEKKLLRNAMAAGVRVLRDEARNQVPAKSGALRRSIKTSRDSKDGRIIAKVRLQGKHAYLGVFMEYGVRPHLISVADEDTPSRNTRHGSRKVAIGTVNKMVARGSLKIGENFVGAYVLHPGHAAKPFLRPAMDTHAKEAVDAVGKYIGTYLQFGQITAPTISVDEEE